jgi:hypothetical protein
MSTRWQGKRSSEPDQSTSLDTDNEATDLAAKYARDLIEMHAGAQEDPEFCDRALGYKKEPKAISEAHLLSNFENGGAQQALHHSVPGDEGQSLSPKAKGRRVPRPNLNSSNDSSAQQPVYFSSPNHVNTPKSAFAGAQFPSPVYGRSASLGFGMPYDAFPSNDDELTAISHTLLANDFMEMDRVITFDGTDFSMSLAGWPDLSNSQQFQQ